MKAPTHKKNKKIIRNKQQTNKRNRSFNFRQITPKSNQVSLNGFSLYILCCPWLVQIEKTSGIEEPKCNMINEPNNLTLMVTSHEMCAKVVFFLNQKLCQFKGGELLRQEIILNNKAAILPTILLSCIPMLHAPL